MPKDLLDDAARHNLLFELVRQKHQADTTVSYVRKHAAPKAKMADFEPLKQAALRSLQAGT